MAVNSHNEIFNTPFLPNNFIVEFRRCIFVILLPIHVCRDTTLLHVTSHDELLVPNDSKFVDTLE